MIDRLTLDLSARSKYLQKLNKRIEFLDAQISDKSTLLDILNQKIEDKTNYLNNLEEYRKRQLEQVINIINYEPEESIKEYTEDDLVPNI